MDELSPFISFTEKADKLINSTFSKEMIGKTGVYLTWEENIQKVVHISPNEEFIDAFVLTFRFFIQNNDSISIKNMSANFNSGIVNKDIKKKFIDVKTKFNDYLDTDTMFDIGGVISRRNILDIFVYGELSHMNPSKKEIYDTWMKNEFMAPLLQFEFKLVLHNALKFIKYVSDLSTQVVLNAQKSHNKPIKQD
jgi:hypothetical protein